MFTTARSIATASTASGYAEGLCPVAEAIYETILTLPMFPAMTRADVERVVRALREIKELT